MTKTAYEIRIEIGSLIEALGISKYEDFCIMTRVVELQAELRAMKAQQAK